MTAAAQRHGPSPAVPDSVTVHLQDSSLMEDLARLRSEVAKSVLHGRREVTVDLSGIDQISSPTVAAILWARRSCSARHVIFTVTGDAGKNVRVLRSCGILNTEGATSW